MTMTIQNRQKQGARAMAAPWRDTILKSLKKNSRLAYARYAQLATVREDGRPANRTIVYR